MAAMSGVVTRFLRSTLSHTNRLRTLSFTTTNRTESQQKNEIQSIKPKRKNTRPHQRKKSPFRLQLQRPQTHPNESRVKISFDENTNENSRTESAFPGSSGLKRDNSEALVKVMNYVGERLQKSKSEQLTKEMVEKLVKDKHFEQLSLEVHKQVEQMMLPALLASAQDLLRMTQEDLFLTKTIETQIIWLLKSMNINNVIKVLSIHKDHRETNLRQEVWLQTLETLTSRYTEIQRAQDLVSIMYALEENHTELLNKLEERAIALCDIMSAKEVCRVLSLLSQRKRRNKPLIGKLVSTISKDNSQLTLPQAQNLLYSCSILQIYDKELIHRATDVIKTHKGAIENVKVISRLLNCCSSLRWRDEELLDTLCSLVVENMSETKPYDIVNLLITSANLDYMPRALSEDLEKVLASIASLHEDNPRQWLDVVWSCAALRCLTPQMVASVHSPEFINNLTGTDSKVLSEISQIKLRNIISAALHETTDYKGPGLEQAHLKIPVRHNRVVLESVIKALSTLAPAEKYLQFDVPHSSGFNIDLELTVSDNGQPVDKNSAQESHHHRLAFKVLDFPDLTLNSARPTGLHAMATRHLGYHGYHVIQIFHTEFLKLMTDVQRVQYLERKIKSVIGSDKL